jgi:hypothetical protein
MTYQQTLDVSKSPDTLLEDCNGQPRMDAPASIRDLFVPSILIPVVNYGFLCVMETALFTLYPLFCSTPIHLGGLGLEPYPIALCIAGWGLSITFLQGFCATRIIRRWGPKRVFFVSMCTYVPTFAIFPLINMLARRQGLTNLVWCAVAFHILVATIIDLVRS